MTTVPVRTARLRSALRVLRARLRQLLAARPAQLRARIEPGSGYLRGRVTRAALAGAALFRRRPQGLPELPAPLLRRLRELPAPGQLLPKPGRLLALASRPDRADRADRRRRPWPARIAASVAWLLAGLVLFSCYLHASRTAAANSDGASNALQAWAMLHGNPLLRGWMLSDVSFYTTELPQYLLIELARGLTPDVVHIAAAMTYTLLVLLAARLAKGGARGLLGVLRALLAAGIMLAPQQSSVHVLLLEPDHVGSAVPVLLLFLLLDRAGRRWFVPPLACLLLSWALIADQVVLITAVGPLVLVTLARSYERMVRRRARVTAAWYELALAAAALAAVALARQAVAMIRAAGGFRVWPVSNMLAPSAALPHNLAQVVAGTLVLFGANFPGQPLGLAAAAALLHLAGIGLVTWAVCAAVRKFAGSPLVVQLLATAVILSVLAYLLGPDASQADSSREFAAVLPLGAALAGRLLAGRLHKARLMPALSAVLAGYLAALAAVCASPAVPAQNQALAGWLAAHRLDYGLADYWLANSVTVDSGGKVAVRAIKCGDRVWPYLWETQPAWYSPQSHVANFVVLPSSGSGPWNLAPSATSVLAAFGQPAKVYFLSDYTILVWNTNLLSRLA